MRQYGRQYKRLNKGKVRIEQQMDNQLQRCNIRFSNYVSNQGNNISLRKVIKGLISGERDPVKLCEHVHGRIKNKHGKDVITASLEGVINTTHGNKYLRQTLVEISWAAARSNRSFLGHKYNHLSKRMKAQKALLAITRKILVIIFILPVS